MTAASIISALFSVHIAAYGSSIADSVTVDEEITAEYEDITLSCDASGNLAYDLMTIDGRVCSTTNKASKGTVLIYGCDTCYNTNSSIRSIAESDWIDDGTVDVYYVDQSSDPSKAEGIKNSIDTPNVNCINFCYDAYGNSSAIFRKYINTFGDSGVKYDTLPFIVVISSDNNVVKVTSGPMTEHYIYSLLNDPTLSEKLLDIRVSGTEDYDGANTALELVNQVRAEAGSSALKMDPDLTEAAMQRAAELAVSFSHTRPDYTRWATVSPKAKAENIAIGYSDVNAAVNGWVNSSGHYANMINSAYTTFGQGCFTDTSGQKYWVQLFGRGEPSEYSKSGYTETVRTVVTSPQVLNLTVKIKTTNENGYSEYEIKACHVNPSFTYYTLPLDSSYVTFSCSDTDTAGIDADGRLYPVRSGTVDVSVTLREIPSLSYTGSVKLSNSTNNNISYFIERLYKILLNRFSEPAGKADWYKQLRSGSVSSAEMVYGIAGSREFANFGLSNEDIVERMYLAMLGRPSDAGGKSSWVDGLNSGMTVNGIINGFSGSQEFANICAGYGIKAGSITSCEPRDKNVNLTAFVSRMYTKALGRAYDVSGLNDWTGDYLDGKKSANDIAYGFILSQEFEGRNLSDEAYVDTLYRTFFDREPDEGGKAGWLDELANGTSRKDVLDGFLGAEEFANLKSSFGV